MGMKIISTGSYVPENIVSNFDLAEIMDTSDEWIRQRTGIGNRRFTKTEDTSDLAIKAAREICQGQDLGKVKFVLVASFTPDIVMPNMASLVHTDLGLSADCFAVDINLACTGFTAGLKLADSYLKEGDLGLVIGAEAISKHLNMDDRSTAVLFGDGAGGFLFRKTEGDLYYNHGFVKDEGNLTMAAKSLQGLPDYIEMNGKEVYKFAVKNVPNTIEKTLALAGLEAEDVTYFTLHQANGRIIQQVAKNLGVSVDKFPMNMESYANTSAASIPLLIDELNKSKKLKEGDLLCLAAFGAGLQYSSMIIEW